MPGSKRPQVKFDFYFHLGTCSSQPLGKTQFQYIPGRAHFSSFRSQQSTLITSIMDNRKKQPEDSSSNVRPWASNPYNSTSRIVHWLKQVESDKENQQYPNLLRSNTTPASLPPQSNTESVTPSAAPVQQETTASAPPLFAQDFVYKWVRRGAMLGIGGSGGWIPASYVRIRVPVATTATAVPSEQGQPRSSSTPQNGNEDSRIQDQSSSLLVAPPNSEADAQSVSDGGKLTCDVNGKPRR